MLSRLQHCSAETSALAFIILKNAPYSVSPEAGNDEFVGFSVFKGPQSVTCAEIIV
jgi:hypothetical protein